MAETPPAPAPPETPPAPTPPEPPKPDEPAGQSVPYDRFKSVNEAKSAAEKRAEEAEKKLKDREEADLSEKDKAEKRAAEAEKKAADAEAKATRLERSQWVTAAARSKNFIDPSDAVAHIELTDLDSEEKATKAVEALAEKKTHLVNSGGPAPIGAPLRQPSAEPPKGPDGEPDHKAGLGKELVDNLFGRRG